MRSLATDNLLRGWGCGLSSAAVGVQKFASLHANVHNHFNQERHLVDRETYKARRSAALAEWQILMA